MTLTKKILLFIALSYFITIATIIVTFKVVIENQFEILENNASKDSLFRISSAIQEKQNALGLTATDYSGWDDTYQYIQDKNIEYEESNIVLETFYGLKVQLMIFLDKDKNIVTVKAVDLEKEEEVQVPNDVYEFIKKDLALFKFSSTTDINTGIVMIDQNIMLVAASPIVTSTKEGPIMGSIVLGKYLDENLISDIAASVKLPIRLVKPSDIPTDSEQPFGDKIFIKKVNHTLLQAYSYLTDVSGKELLAIETTSQREIHQQGQRIQNIFTILLAVLAVIAIVIGSLVLRTILVKPIRSLIDDLQEIKNSGSTSLRVKEQGKDELSFISKEINNMLNSLDTSEQQLMNLNRELSEQKRGVEKEVQLRTKQLTEVHIRLLAAIDSSPYGFAMYDLNNNIILSNKAIRDIIEVQKVSFEDLKQEIEKIPSISAMRLQTIKDCKANTLDNIEYKNKILKVIFSPVLENYTEIKDVILTVIDVSEEKILERSKEELFSIASHELRTPLTAIKGNISLIKDLYYQTFTDLKLRRMFDDVNTAALRMIKLVNDFLVTSKLENSKMAFSYKDFQIETIMTNILSELEVTLKEKGISLEYKPALPSNELEVHADLDKTREVFINLISNAIKFTEKGTITIKADKIANGEFVEIEVTDTGKGIAPENQQLLFRKFQQAGTSILARDTSQGTGLGLYISKLIVEGMGGKITLKSSQVGVGTSFVFTLPAKKE